MKESSQHHAKISENVLKTGSLSFIASTQYQHYKMYHCKTIWYIRR